MKSCSVPIAVSVVRLPWYCTAVAELLSPIPAPAPGAAYRVQQCIDVISLSIGRAAAFTRGASGVDGTAAAASASGSVQVACSDDVHVARDEHLDAVGTVGAIGAPAN